MSKWRSLTKEIPYDGQIVDLHAFDPVNGWEEYHYALPTIIHEYVEPCAWQTIRGWLVLAPEITVWRPARSAADDDLLRYYLKERLYNNDNWAIDFAPDALKKQPLEGTID